MKNRRRRVIIAILVVLLAVVGFGYEPGKDLVKATIADRTPRTTPFPSSMEPDQVFLTWNGDPATSQTVQWRAALDESEGSVQYKKAGEGEQQVAEVKAERAIVTDKMLENDTRISRFTAVLQGLTPATAYQYRVGDGSRNVWTDWYQFTTGPDKAQSFSFAYFGDIQIGFDDWGKLLHQVRAQRPDVDFYLIPGDIVNRGLYREDWDMFFNAAKGVAESLPLVSAIGNHECPREREPRFYLELLALPENAPREDLRERTYSFRYGNALFMVLDSNVKPKIQRAWLEEQLKNSKDTWKFVVYHQPAYSSVTHRDNDDVQTWTELFDKYHVDVALQGHDHAYLRTYPMRDGKKAESPEQGTIYTIAVSGNKFYKQDDSYDYAAVAFPDTPTYQIVEIQAGDANQLTYRAYDAKNEIKDEFVIRK